MSGRSNAASIALNRFGLGARADQPVSSDPRALLTAQFDVYDSKSDIIAAALTSASVSAELADYFRRQRALRVQQGAQAAATAAAPAMTADAIKQARQFAVRTSQGDYAGAVDARANSALVTPTPFALLLVAPDSCGDRLM